MPTSLDRDAFTTSLLAACRELAREGRWPAEGLAPFEDARLRKLAWRHELVPPTAAGGGGPGPASPGLSRTGAADPELTEEARAKWERRYWRLSGRALLAREQVGEIGSALAEAGVPAVALKGGAALPWLYPGGWSRPLLDLDLLVAPEHLLTAAAVMERLGYAPMDSVTSAEEARVRLARAHLPPYARPGRLPVELHVVLPDALPRAAADVLRDAAPLPAPVLLRRPSAAHFVLHTATHYHAGLEQGFASLKGLVDILRVLHLEGSAIDWERFWTDAERWGVSFRVAPVMRALAEHCGAEVPGLPGGGPRLPAAHLVYGRSDEDGPRRRAASEYLEQAALVRELPDLPSRARYLFHLVFPAPGYLRAVYHLPPERSVARYYVRHPIRQVARIARGTLRALGDKMRGNPAGG